MKICYIVLLQLDNTCDIAMATEQPNLLDDDGTLGGTNETETGDGGTSKLSLNCKVCAGPIDLTLPKLLAHQLKTTGVLDADLGLVGMLLDGEGFHTLTLPI